MADLSNITALSGLTITSDQTTGTNNPNATLSIPCVTTAQRDLLENVTPYVVNGATVRIKQGTLIFNITKNIFQIFINGVWQTIFSSQAERVTGDALDGIPFILPSGPQDVITRDNNENGFLFYNTTYKQLQAYINGVWQTIFAYKETEQVTSTGLDGTPFIFPSGTKAAVEVTANQINGFTYFDETSNNLRIYDSGWKTINPT